MDARHTNAERQYQRLRATGVRLKSISEGYRNSLNSDVPVAALVNMHKGLKRTMETIISLYSANVSTVAAAIHDAAGDAGYVLLPDLQALNVLVDAARTEVRAVVPLSADGSPIERTFDETGEVENTVAPAALVDLAAAIDALSASIQAN